MASAIRPLIDGFGRVVSDLRISITDRCNFRCTYCMPAEGLAWIDRRELLSFEEIERLARLFVERFGVRSIRLTGGEPLVRADLPRLVELLAALDVDLALTTNGAGLRLVARDLAAAGLRRVNVSLDSLRRERFAAITRRDRLDSVLDGIDAAVAAGLAPVKVNVVVVGGRNDDEVVDLARFGRDRGVEVRFIEFMPLEAGDTWEPGVVVPSAEILRRVDEVFPTDPVPNGAAPATMFRYRDGRGLVGVIGSVSEPFCSTCDRVRLTAEGQFRTCLFSVEETDLRAVLRGGGSDDELAALIAGAVSRKWAGHGVGTETFVRPPRTMSQIGG